MTPSSQIVGTQAVSVPPGRPPSSSPGGTALMKHRYPCSSAPSDADTVRELYVEYQPEFKERHREPVSLFLDSNVISNNSAAVRPPWPQRPDSVKVHIGIVNCLRRSWAAFGVHQCMPSSSRSNAAIRVSKRSRARFFPPSPEHPAGSGGRAFSVVHSWPGGHKGQPQSRYQQMLRPLRLLRGPDRR